MESPPFSFERRSCARRYGHLLANGQPDPLRNMPKTPLSSQCQALTCGTRSPGLKRTGCCRRGRIFGLSEGVIGPQNAPEGPLSALEGATRRQDVGESATVPATVGRARSQRKGLATNRASPLRLGQRMNHGPGGEMIPALSPVPLRARLPAPVTSILNAHPGWTDGSRFPQRG